LAKRRIKLKGSSVLAYVKTLQMLLRRVHPNDRANHDSGLTDFDFVDDEQFEVLESGCLWDEALSSLNQPTNARDSS
jgi:hypothetical protein